ncbi:MAG: isocitrate/isopropylmalate dehydrogenase family protein [Chloroflexi bacterium]|uniref:isocitrate/isopropylmalate dehydrogenase family protein n=1 Tax=Candidatus Flexifilum breve TaxID=3140694 RepID=UPI003137029C|nr:isocitrate/isopropylmalate dehydrogenase family protein [Chloroflexota bacterium]
MPKIVLINGDGIGAEVIPAAHQVLAALDLPLEFVYANAGFGTFEKTGNALPDETIELCLSADSALFGATQSPMTKVDGYKSPILQLRRRFDLFANLRPAQREAIDLLIVRENTEGMYSGRERLEDDGETAILERVITRKASERIVRAACEQARSRRSKLTIVHKANVLKETCGLFRRVALDVTAQYPDLQVNELLVDTAAMVLVQDAPRFDVIVTTNLFGDILSDLAAGLTGGLGIAASANVGAGRFGVFEPVHGSAPDIAGQGIADPRAAILSAALMLDHLGYADAATKLRAVTYATPHTGSTTDTVAAILHHLN